MNDLLITVLSDISAKINTGFALFDENGEMIFCKGNFDENPNERNIFLAGKTYKLKAALSKEQLEDFCFLIENIVKSRYDMELAAFIRGKSSLVSGFPFPSGLILVKNEILRCAQNDRELKGDKEFQGGGNSRDGSNLAVKGSGFIAANNNLIDKIREFVEEAFEEGIVTNIDSMLALILPAEDRNELKEAAEALYQTLAEEVSEKTVISLGGIVHSQADLHRAFINAQKALEFASGRRFGVLSYTEMPLELIISQIPAEARNEYKNEIDFENLDKDTLTTIRVFLDCNLHIAEAARKLYIHRNTLIYRLDKIYAITGLDLRDFDDALKMRIYLMLHEFF